MPRLPWLPGPALTCVGQRTVALVPGHIIDARALVQARVGRTLVDVGLAVGAWRESASGRHAHPHGAVAGSTAGPSSSPGLQPEPRAAPTPAAAGAHGGREAPRVAPEPPARPGSLTTEALAAGAHVAAGHVPAGATVGTRVGLTLVVVHVTVGAAPPGVTVTLVPAQGTAGWFTRTHAPVSTATLRSDGTEGLIPSDPRSP